MPADELGPEALWDLLRRIIEHQDSSIRIIGIFVAHRLAETGEERVQLTYGEIGEACGLTAHPVRDRLDRMEEERLIRRQRRRGRPNAGERKGETRGDYYSLAIGDLPAAPSPNPPARAGPTNVRPEGVTSSPEPQGGLRSPDKECEPGNTDHP